MKYYFFKYYYLLSENIIMNKNTKINRLLNKYLVQIILLFFIIASAFFSLFFTSCVSLKTREPITISRRILDKGVLTANELADYFIMNNKGYKYKDIVKFAQIYIDEANMENINSDVAFAQMCLETGYLTFGNLVTIDMNNFCGLGAMDADHPGEKFATPALGVRAHIQHLQAYATTADVALNNTLIDPRYNWVHKTKYIQNIYELAGSWAMDKEYGNKQNNILSRMESMVNTY